MQIDEGKQEPTSTTPKPLSPSQDPQAKTPPSVKMEEPATPNSPSSSDQTKTGINETTPLSPSKVAKENEPPTSTPTSPTKAPASPVKAKSDRSDETPAMSENNQPDVKLFKVEEHHETEEVIERLLDVKGLEQSVSGLWGWMSGGVSKVAEQASKVAEKATVVAKEASQQASIVAEKASQQASIVAEKASKARAVAEQQAKELAASVSKTMEDKSTADSQPALVIPQANLPWETAHPERRAEARERVLKLSMDDHTFTVPPPKEAQYVYDAAAREPFAARMLDTDALLSAKRFKLVPKTVDEVEFWRNYFYRVDLILSALGVPATLSTTSDSKEQKEIAETKAAAATRGDAARQRDLEEEMRKEIARAEASHLEEAVKDDENFDMLEDDLEFEDDAELEKSLNDLKL